MKYPCTRRPALLPLNNSDKRCPGGYLLAEVILAMAVLAIAAAVVLGSFSSSLRASRSSENMTRAAMLLRERTDAAIKSGSDGREQGGFGARAPGFSWSTAPGDSQCVSNICPVTITVMWRERGSAARMSATVLAPPIAKKEHL